MRVMIRAIALSMLLVALPGCETSDKDYQVALLGTWVSREVAQDDVIVETQVPNSAT